MKPVPCFGKYIEWKLRCTYCVEKIPCLKQKSRLLESKRVLDHLKGIKSKVVLKI